MRRWSWLAGLQMVLTLSACQCRREQAGTSDACPKGMEIVRRWQSAELVGFELSAVDPDRTTSFAFVSSEYATMTNPMLALGWNIDSDGVVHLNGDFGDHRIAFTLRKACEGQGAFIAALDLVAESKGSVIVERKGERLRLAKRLFPQPVPARRP